eukprot:TRINITY_DN2258_c0_g1_i1.p1 TRINITY_DN2258_c0_g1~~TRINITY_DN2258_c0_g1_i1.p1  ORF type:complete len:674 (-),score=150.31 TRINITY_DN2258_c0_g1_i1:448-2469(-)
MTSRENGNAGSAPLTVKAKYKPSGKGAGFDGVLMMRARGFTWIPNDPSAVVRLDVDFKTIKSHRWSKETPTATSALLKFGTNPDPAAEGGYIFVFSSFKDRDTCRDIYGAFQAKFQTLAAPQQQKGAAPAATPSAGPGAPIGPGGAATAPAAAGAAAPGSHVRLDATEVQQRQDLLQSDGNLRRLHQELVMSGILKEEEFWATRKELLGDDISRKRKRQQTGIASAMLADVRPVTDSSANRVTFNLSPEIIAQIFAEKPPVLRAFLECVPARMSEKEFWTKYCKAEYLLHTKVSAAAIAEAAEDEDLAMFVKDDDGTTPAQEASKIRRVDPTLNMAADDADDYTSSGSHGILRDGAKEAGSGFEATKKGSRRIFREINRHAAVVLEGRFLDDDVSDAQTVAMALAARAREDANQASGHGEAANPEEELRREDRLREATEMDDLLGALPPPVVPLRIQDPRRYFDNQTSQATPGTEGEQGTGGGTNLSAHEVASEFRRQVAAAHERRAAQGGILVMQPDSALKVVKELQQHISAARQLGGTSAEQSVLAPLPESLRTALFSHAEAVKELLRHFWSTYPISSQLLLDKAERHKKGIDLLYDKLEKCKSSPVAKDQRHRVSQLLQPLFQSLDAALAHHEADVQKRAQKASAGRGGGGGGGRGGGPQSSVSATAVAR